MDFYTYFSVDFIVGLLTPFVGIYSYYKYKKNTKETLAQLTEKNYYQKKLNFQLKLLNNIEPLSVINYSIMCSVILYFMCVNYNFNIITKHKIENNYLNNNIL